MSRPLPTVVLLPGLACDAELLAPQAEALAAAGHRVVTALPHFRETTLPAMAERLLHEHAGPLWLVGSSMGGMVALHAALAAAAEPERVRGVAVLGSTARADPPAMLTLRREACSLFAAGRMDEVLRANAAIAFHPHAARDRGLVARYLAMVRRAGAEQLIRQNEAVMAREDLRPRLPALALPLLVVVGEADRLTPPEHAREIAAAVPGVPGARLEIVPGAGHLLSWEQPARVNRLLLAWLASCDPSP